MPKISIEKAAKLLGRELVGKNPHIVGTFIEYRNGKLILVVDIDSEEPRAFLEKKLSNI